MKWITTATLLVIVSISGAVLPLQPVLSADSEGGYNPKAAIHLSRANILIREGDKEGAESEMRLAVSADPGSEFLRIKLVEILFQLEKYRDAVQVLKSPEVTYTDVKSYLYLGLAHQYLGENDEAIKVFDSIFELDNVTAEDLIHVGRIFNYEEKYREALRFFDRAEKMTSASAELHELKGEAYIGMEEIGKARKEYRKSVELEPDRINSWLVLAQLAESEEKWEEALEYYGTILGLSSHPATILESVMRISGQLGDFSRAVKITRELVERFPDNGLLWGMLGVLYYQVESLEEANEALEKAIEMGVSSFQLYLTLGRSLMEMGKGEEAILNLEKAVTIEPEALIGWINLALAYFSIDDYEKAMASLETARKLDPESSQALYLKGVVLSRMERFVEAIEPLERALLSAPDNREIIFSLAVAYERTGQREKAEELLQKILISDPDDSQAMNYLGYMWAERGERLDEAEKLITRAIEIEPENGYYIDSIAWVFYQRGEYRKALREMLRSIELAADDPVIFEHLGDIYQKLDRHGDAIEAWEKALEIDPDNAEIREKIESLQSANGHEE